MGVKSILKVKLKNRAYPIYIGQNIFKKIPSLFSRIKTGNKVMIITNPLLAKYFGNKLKGLLESKTDKDIYLLVLPLEEKNKNLKTIERIFQELTKNNFERSSSLIALGGGVIGDIVGYASATYLRGINYFQVPTTLLAQVDSSVGGKTAVNLATGKNLVGAFYQPKAVFIDSDPLESLSKKEWLGGLAEVIKYGVIQDKALFAYLEKLFPVLPAPKKICLKDFDLQKIIKRCCEIKANVVSKDEKESGLRAILNYGHTIGHAIEILTKHKYNHGEAVALGMTAASYIAEDMHLVNNSFVQRQKNLLKKVGLPIMLKNINLRKLIDIMKLDKKVKNGKIRFVLPVKIGKVKIFNNVTTAQIENALQRLQNEKGVLS
ncbi:3-dehydroquinate synthase [Candidatus Margulisiibacteriota bacterium]